MLCNVEKSALGKYKTAATIAPCPICTWNSNQSITCLSLGCVPPFVQINSLYYGISMQNQQLHCWYSTPANTLAHLFTKCTCSRTNSVQIKIIYYNAEISHTFCFILVYSLAVLLIYGWYALLLYAIPPIFYYPTWSVIRVNSQYTLYEYIILKI